MYPFLPHRSGMTLLEVVIALAVMSLIATLVFGALSAFRESSGLDQALDTAIGFLREAHEKTLASEKATSYGVYFQTNAITLFSGGVWQSGDPGNVVYALPGGISISGINLTTTTASVVFDRLTGASPVTGTVVFSSARSGTSKRIQIFSSGLSQKQ